MRRIVTVADVSNLCPWDISSILSLDLKPADPTCRPKGLQQCSVMGGFASAVARWQGEVAMVITARS